MVNLIRNKTHSLSLFYRRILQKIWLRHASISLISIFVATFALWFGKNYPQYYLLHISNDSLSSLFTIFASSMLSVATFTVSAIVAATSSATQSTTPRASRLIIQDNKAQFVLSSFIAAFIYSIISLISLKAFDYGNSGRFVLFIFLISILVLVLVSFIQWVDHITRLGRQSSTIDKLVLSAKNSINACTVNFLGGKPLKSLIPEDYFAIASDRSGYITSIDMQKLQSIAERSCHEILIPVYPGDFITSNKIIAHTKDPLTDEKIIKEIRSSIILSDWRDSTYDIRFNILNLAEAADKALPPANSDPGTAINILNIYFEIFEKIHQISSSFQESQIKYDRIYTQPLYLEDVVFDAFTPIARDGAAIVEIGVRLQKVLTAIYELENKELKEACRKMSQEALELSDRKMEIESHKVRVRNASNIL